MILFVLLFASSTVASLIAWGFGISKRTLTIIALLIGSPFAYNFYQKNKNMKAVIITESAVKQAGATLRTSLQDLTKEVEPPQPPSPWSKFSQGVDTTWHAMFSVLKTTVTVGKLIIMALGVMILGKIYLILKTN